MRIATCKLDRQAVQRQYMPLASAIIHHSHAMVASHGLRRRRAMQMKVVGGRIAEPNKKRPTKYNEIRYPVKRYERSKHNNLTGKR